MKYESRVAPHTAIIFAGLFLWFAVPGCGFMSTRAISIEPHWLRDSSQVTNDAKVFTKDGHIYLFHDGFSFQHYQISGEADRYTTAGSHHRGLEQIELDSIIAITAYGPYQNSGTNVASTIGAIYLGFFPIMYFGIAVANGYP
jgi:hypothetical protein